MRVFFITCSVIIFQSIGIRTSIAQSNCNLIVDGSFELKTRTPTTWGEAHLLKYWNSFYTGKWSPVTYFFEFENGGYIPTWKQGGKQSPHSGNGFIGLGIAFRNIEDVGSQYIESKLLNPLEKDSIYIISAFVSLADRLKYAIDYIPVAFSERTMLRNGVKSIYASNLVKLKAEQPYLENTTEWIKVSAMYKAMGNEQFFLIGGIEGNKKLGAELKAKKMSLNISFRYLLLSKLTYYFIDDISIQKLSPIKKRIEADELVDSDSLKGESDKIILDDIIFESNSFKLNDTSNQQLDALVLQLKSCNTYTIKIAGFTDSIGLREANLHLSLMRAKTIFSYLYTKGIAAERMEYQGFGESSPIGNNNLPEGRSKNRRVEVWIYKP